MLNKNIKRILFIVIICIIFILVNYTTKHKVNNNGNEYNNENSINVKRIGAKGDGKSDDTQAIINAIKKAIDENINTIYFPKGQYAVSKTISIPDSIHIVGDGRSNNGTVIKRTKDITVFQAKGNSITSSGENNKISGFMFENMLFNTGDFKKQPYMDLTNVTSFRIYNCLFLGKGRQLLIWEGFDSRIVDTDFEWGGDIDGIPAVELRSTDGGDLLNKQYEYTNQIYFQGCRFESYQGTALTTTGNNTNEINIDNCKFESIDTKQPHIIFNNCTSLNISNTQVCLGGEEKGYPIQFNSVVNSNIDVNYEYSEWQKKQVEIEPISITGNTRGNYMRFRSFIAKDLLYKVENLIYTDMDENTFNSNNIDFMVGDYDNNKLKKYPVNRIIKYDDTSRLEIKSASETSFKLEREGYKGYWDVGRLEAKEKEINFRIVHNDGIKETVPLAIDYKDQVSINGNTFFSGTINLKQTPITLPTDRDGTIYVNTSNDIPTISQSINGEYRNISYNENQPTSGKWKKGTLIYNTNPEPNSYIGWVCTETGSPGKWNPFGKIEK